MTEVNPRAIPVVVSILIAGLWISSSIADIQDWIFADGFESGDASAWSASNGPYLVIPGAASDGAYGLRIPATFAEPAWVLDANPSDDQVVRTDFDVNFDGLAMLEGDSFDFYAGYVVHDTEPAFVVTLDRLNGQFQIVLTAWANGGMIVTSGPVAVPGSGWHRMAIEYGVATSPLGEGELRVFLDGAPLTGLADFDNSDFAVNTLQLGAIAGVDPTTTGFFDVDVYTSVRLFNPWPCALSGTGDPEDGRPLCLDAEGKSTGIAVGGCGDGIVVWKGAEDVDLGRSRIGGIYGRPVRGTTDGQPETFSIIQDETARTPDVAMDDQCNSATAWSSSLDGEGVFTAVFDRAGTQLTPIVQVSEGTEAEESPAVAAAADGSYLVAWRRTDNGEQSVFGRFFAPDATPLGPEFPVDLGGGQTSFPDAAMNGAGASVVVWEAQGAIMAHPFDAPGGSLGVVNLTQGPADGAPAVATMADGGFAAVWTRSTTDQKVFLRLYDQDGAPLSDEIRVDTLGEALMASRQTRDALEAFTRALDLMLPIAALDPSNAYYRNDLAYSHLQVGKARAALGQTTAAREAWTEAAAVVAPIADEDALPAIQETFAQALLLIGRVDEARPVIRRVLDAGWPLDPTTEQLCRQHGIEVE